MKHNQKMIERLNILLADELTAVDQYLVHAEMCDKWGYSKLHDAIKKRAIDEMKHVEKIIARILFLEGIPELSSINKIAIGADIEKQFSNDKAAESEAIKKYLDGIKLCAELNDNGTKEMLHLILMDEEKHLDWIEIQIEQIKQLGIKNYLLERVEYMQI